MTQKNLVHLRDMSQQPVASRTPFTLTWRVDFLFTLETLKACRARALRIVALVDLGVGITQLDGDISLQLVLETDGLDLGDGLDDGRLPVSDVANGTDVDGGLAGNNFRRQRREFRQVEGIWVWLLGQLWALRLRNAGNTAGLLHGGLLGLFGLLLQRLLVIEVIVASVRTHHGGAGMGFIVGKIAVGSHDCGVKTRPAAGSGSGRVVVGEMAWKRSRENCSLEGDMIRVCGGVFGLWAVEDQTRHSSFLSLFDGVLSSYSTVEIVLF